MKILFVDTEKRFPFVFDLYARTLISKGFKVDKFEWKKTWDNFYEEIINQEADALLEKAKEFNVVVLHLGDIPRGRAATIIDELKAIGVKIIVDSQSSLLFEKADAVLPLESMDELVQIINALVAKKDSS